MALTPNLTHSGRSILKCPQVPVDAPCWSSCVRNFMSSDSHIIVVRFGEVLPGELGGFLEARGYRVTEPVRLDDALPDWARIESPILLIDCSRSRSTTERIVRALIEHRRILNCPIVVTSTDHRGVSELLSHYFPIALSLQHPCSTDDVYRALKTAARARDRIGETEPLFMDPSFCESRSLSAAIERLGIPEEGPEERVLSSGVASISETLFSHLGSGRIELSALRGEALTQRMILSDLIAAGLAPTDERCLGVSREFLERLDRSGRRHVLRTAALVGRLMEALHVSPSRRDVGAAAVLTYALGFGEEDPDLVRQSYLSRRHRDVRARFASGLELSAERVEADLARPDIAAVLRGFRAIVAHTSLESVSPENIELAMIVFGADSVARICFQSGWWNPRHAYKVLQRLESGWFVDLPPQVASALAKVVAAAVSEQPRSFIVPLRIRTDPRLLSIARAQREATLRADERRVEVADLIPGMRLSRPVDTFDGTTVLESELRLDHDLIWRLWRLSAIRPMNGPLIVQDNGDDRLHELGDGEYAEPATLGAEIDAILARCGP